ncbi:hypothetical protein YC2023_060139 [Brassica napus]
MADNCVKSHKREVRERKKWSRFGTDHNFYMLFWFQGTDASQVSSALDLAASFASMNLN